MQAEARLKTNVGGLWSGVFQSMAFIAPAATAASFYVVEAGIAGVAVPLTFLIAIIGVSSAMYMNYEFSKRISHAGGYYAYVSAGLGPRFSVFAGWLYFINLLGALSGFSVLFFAGVLWPMVPALSANPYGWVPLAFIPLLIILVLLYRGLKPSLYYTLIGAAAEVVFLIVVSIIIIIKVGPANTIVPFTTAGNSFGHLGLATVYAILGFVGVGSVITLSEELKSPKKNVPKAIFVALAIAAVTYLLSSYALVVGWGTANISAFATATNPGFTVVGKFIGPIGMAIFIILTLNSFISNGIAEGNAFSRTGFALARDNVLFKRSQAVVHQKYGSPTTVIFIEWVVIAAIAIIGGLIFGPFVAAAVITTLNGACLYIVHILANFSLPVYGKRTLRVKMKGLLPLALGPLLATVVYAFALFGVFFPIPAYPLNIASYLLIATVIIGVIIVAVAVRGRSKSEMNTVGRQVTSDEE